MCVCVCVCVVLRVRFCIINKYSTSLWLVNKKFHYTFHFSLLSFPDKIQIVRVISMRSGSHIDITDRNGSGPLRRLSMKGDFAVLSCRIVAANGSVAVNSRFMYPLFTVRVCNRFMLYVFIMLTYGSCQRCYWALYAPVLGFIVHYIGPYSLFWMN